MATDNLQNESLKAIKQFTLSDLHFRRITLTSVWEKGKRKDE